MSDCTDCRDSLLNGQDSINGLPICHDNCGSETNCEGIQTYSDCVGINPALPCIGTTGATSQNPVSLSDVLLLMDTKLCQVTTANCSVKVSATDPCCDYLINKITAGTGISLTKTTIAPSNCEKIVIAASPGTLVWNNFNLNSNVATVPNYQVPQYSDKDALGRVWFRGSFKNAINTNPIIPYYPFSNLLPSGSRTQYIRSSFNGKNAQPTTAIPELTVNPNGTIVIVWGAANAGSGGAPTRVGQFSLDGFYIDTNLN